MPNFISEDQIEKAGVSLLEKRPGSPQDLRARTSGPGAVVMRLRPFDLDW